MSTLDETKPWFISLRRSTQNNDKLLLKCYPPTQRAYGVILHQDSVPGLP